MAQGALNVIIDSIGGIGGGGFRCAPSGHHFVLGPDQRSEHGAARGEGELLRGWPELCLSRATIDNDGIRLWTGQEARPMGQWAAAGFANLQIVSREQTPLEDGGIKRVTVLTGSDPEKPIVHGETIRMLEDGAIEVQNRVEIDAGLPGPARVGLVCATAPGFDQIEWFGRGPGESHADRKAGSPVGRYRGSVDEQLVNYILPQENGNKTDVRWFALSDGEWTLRFDGAPWMEFSVHHFTDADLTASLHTHELAERRRPETWIHLDHRQRGVGTGSCGSQALPEYCVDPGRYEFTYTIRVLNSPYSHN
ncbi:MAG: beta-galactosidase small subunit [Kiritimatiellia bacterium]